MRTVDAHLPLLHEVDVMEAGARKPKSHVVRSGVPFPVADLESRALDVVAVATVNGRRYTTYAVDDRFLCAQDVLAPMTSASASGERLRLVSPLSQGTIDTPFSQFHELPSLLAALSNGGKGAARVVGDSAALRAAEASEAYARRLACVDGVLLPSVPHEPCWEVTTVGDTMAVLRPALRPTYVRPDYFGREPHSIMHFRADLGDLAWESCLSYAADRGMEAVRSSGGIKVVEPGLLRFGEDLAVGGSLLSSARTVHVKLCNQRGPLYGKGLPLSDWKPEGWTDVEEAFVSSLASLVRVPDHLRDGRWSAAMAEAFLRCRDLHASGRDTTRAFYLLASHSQPALDEWRRLVADGLTSAPEGGTDLTEEEADALRM